MKRHRTWVMLLAVAFLMVLEGPVQLGAQEKPKQESAPKEAAALTISRLVVCLGVENLEPVQPAETFPASTEKVYGFLEAKNIEKDMEVSLVWLYGEKELLKTTLPLKAGPKWRTYAHKTLRGLKGEWKVQVRGADDKVLNEVKFNIE